MLDLPANSRLVCPGSGFFATGHKFLKNKIYLILLLVTLGGCGLGIDADGHVERARTSMLAGDRAKAVIELKNALQKDSEHFEARLLLADASFLSGDFAGAQKESERALALRPGSVEAAEVYAEVLLAQGKTVEALDFLEAYDTDGAPELLTLNAELLANDGQYVRATTLFETARGASSVGNDVYSRAAIGLAEIQWRTGERSAAQRAISQLIENQPKLISAYLVRADWMLSIGETDAAEKSLQAARRAMDASVPLHIRVQVLSSLLDMMIVRGQTEAVDDVLGELRALGTNIPAVIYASAQVALRDGDVEQAGRLLESLIRFVPENEQLLTMLGGVRLAERNFGQAEMYLNRALSIGPENGEALKMLAKTKLEQGRPDSAIELIAPALGSQAADSELYALYNLAQLREGNTDGAVIFAEGLFAEDPADESRALQLAYAYVRSEQLDKARAVLTDVGGTDAGSIEDLIKLAVQEGAESQRFTERVAELGRDAATSSRTLTAAGLMSLAVGQTQVAENTFKAAATRTPPSAAANVNLATLAYRRDDLSSANRLFREALTLQPGNLTAMTGLTRVAASRGDLARARVLAEEALTLHADSPMLKALLGTVFLASRDMERASQIAVAARRDHPNNTDVLKLNGDVSLLGRNYSDAINFYQGALAQNPNRNDIALLFGRALLAADRVEDAVEVLGELARLLPDARNPRFLHAQALYRAQEIDETLRVLAALKRDFPGNAEIFLYESFVQLALNNPEAALGSAERAHQLEPDGETVIAMFQARRGAGRSEPDSVLRSWLQDRPDDLPVALELGAHLEGINRRDEAIRYYEQLLARMPENPVLLNNAAWAMFQVSPGARSLELAKKAYEIDPRFPQIADTYGWILANVAEDYSGAAEILRKARLSVPDDADIAYHYAWVLARSGDAETAISILDPLVERIEPFGAAADAAELLEELRSAGG